MAQDAPATTYKWQPIMLVIEGRMECEDCGALAVFIVCEQPDEPHRPNEWRTQSLCQPCWMRHENETDDDEDE